MKKMLLILMTIGMIISFGCATYHPPEVITPTCPKVVIKEKAKQHIPNWKLMKYDDQELLVLPKSEAIFLINNLEADRDYYDKLIQDLKDLDMVED